ncbi:MAG: MBL fold metallo-hydrolase [Dehalococcoidales bacterium]|nr:MBL fold metallo-hydrolase [Dehalococcoidales bacterium]
MQIKITFLGAARNVTGSRFLVEANGIKFLVDCGLYQERELKERDWMPFPIAPQSIDAVLLTHAHLDHCGYLPKLVREGFSNQIYCTDATSDIVEIMLMDSANVQQQDAENKKRRHEREKKKALHPEIPLYTTDDVETCLPYLSSVPYKRTVQLGEGISCTFHDAGHVLGAATIEVRIKQNGEERVLLFSGDVGRRGRPILHDPTTFTEADYVLIESTYGDRLLESPDSLLQNLVDIINATVEAGGNIVIPSFALERAQDILYYLSRAFDEKLIKPIKVLLDSPMAVDITKIFRRHIDLFDEEAKSLIRQRKSPFEFPGLKFITDVEQSKEIAQLKEPAIIIAGSGMCNGGRIKYHLIPNITRAESTILFVGYQAIGTLGRQIIDGSQDVRILGKTYPVKARIAQLNGFSSHADKDQLLWWLSSLTHPPRHTFVVHGEEKSATSFARTVEETKSWKVTVPGYLDEFVLD